MTEYHQPVMLNECLEGLNIKPNGIYVDVTFGGGGHSEQILSKLKKGKLVAFDQDADAKSNVLKDKRFIFVQHNFRFLKHFLLYHNIEKIDGLLADLGVSSHHFNEPERGFSFRFDAPIDMRMNKSAELTGKELLNTYEGRDLCRIFREYGELKNVEKIAGEIIQFRKAKTIESTFDLLEAVKPCTPKQDENQFLAKLFQAVRIEVNKEIETLKHMLEDAVDFLAPGGRLVVMSYHSLEDRLVKNLIKNGTFKKQETVDLFGQSKQILKVVNRKVIVPTDQEIQKNNRARSAKLRIAEKL